MLLKHLLHVTLQYKLEWESKKNKYKYIYEYFIEKIPLKEKSFMGFAEFPTSCHLLFSLAVFSFTQQNQYILYGTFENLNNLGRGTQYLGSQENTFGIIGNIVIKIRN